MDWLQFILFILSVGGATLGTALWIRSEAREGRRESQAERREFKQEFEAERRESREDRRTLSTEIRGLREDFNKEMKDFHGRLCSLEEKYIQMMQRMLEKR